MSKIYALEISKKDGSTAIIPILMDDETLAKELANRYANANPQVGDFHYNVIYSDVDWQPYEADD